MKFLGITGRNLDEFYMIRVATTLKKLQEGIEDIAPDGYNTEQQLDAMRGGAMRLLHAQAGVWEELRRELTTQRISFLEVDQWTSAIREHLSSYFSREICPVLTPLAFDPGHPFPLVSNLSKNFAVVVRHGGRTKFARVKVPDTLPRFIPLPEPLSAPGALRFVFLEDVIEKPDQATYVAEGDDFYVSMNCWRFGPSIFTACRSIEPSSRGELELPNAVRYAVRTMGERFRAVPVDEGVLDLSRRADVAEVGRRLAEIEPDP